MVGALATTPANAQGVGRWTPFVSEASSRFGVPIDWIERVMVVESGGAPARNGRPIRSRAGAMGLMQLMPATWAAMRAAFALGGNPDDPRANIMAGTAYLRLMYDRFGYPGLFAAYNAGPGRYARALAGQGGLPAETRMYLARVAGTDDRSFAVRLPAHDGLFAIHAPPVEPRLPVQPAASPLFLILRIQADQSEAE